MNRTSRRLAVLGSALVGLLSPAAAPARPGRRPGVRRPRRLLRLGHRHPLLHQRRHQLPALDPGLPEPDRRGPRLRPQLPRLLGRDRIADVTNTQLSALTSATSYVSISVGGNDAGFADVLTECAQPGWMSNCDGAINTAQSFINSTLPAPARHPLLRHPQPRALRQGRRGRLPADLQRRGLQRLHLVLPGRGVAAQPDRRPAQLPARRGRLGAPASPSPTRPAAFVGHAVCDAVEWINGLSNPISESYHPKATGHAGGYTPDGEPAADRRRRRRDRAGRRRLVRERWRARPRCSSSTPTRTAPSSRRSSSPPT